MYNLDKDPSCIHNLTESEAHETIQKQLIARLESELKGSPISLSDKKTFNNTISEITTLKKNILCFKERTGAK